MIQIEMRITSLALLIGIYVGAKTRDDHYVDLSLERMSDYFSPSVFIPIFVRESSAMILKTVYWISGLSQLC